MVVQINNAELKKAFSGSTKTQMVEQPNLVDNRVVVPTIDVTPRNHKLADEFAFGSATNATSATLLSATNKDFYITAFVLGVAKDATATSTSSRLVCTINGKSCVIARIEGFTLTAQNSVISLNLSTPIKVDKNTSITITNTTAVANITSYACIHGYYDEAI